MSYNDEHPWYTDSLVQRVRQNISILDVLDKFGAILPFYERRYVPGQEEVEVFCPFCDDLMSEKPAGRANVLSNLYYCFACGTGGDVIKLTMRALNCDRAAALAWLQQKFMGE